MQKLKQDNNSYYITSRHNFNSFSQLSNHIVSRCFDFAYSMTFGEMGKQRDHRTGGNHRRKNGEIFINTFQGKATEFAFYTYLRDNNIECSEPDFDMWELGKWDSCDFNVNGHPINIKSTKHYGNLLLLETHDWNKDAQYVPNLSTNNLSEYEYFVLIRLSPDGEKIMRGEKLLYSDSVSKDNLMNLISKQKWEFDIPGYITCDNFKDIMSNKYILPQGSLLNGTTVMDTENYYVQSGDMLPAKDLIKYLSEKCPQNIKRSKQITKNKCEIYDQEFGKWLES